MKLTNTIIRTITLIIGLVLLPLSLYSQNDEEGGSIRVRGNEFFEHLAVQPPDAWMFMKYGPSKPNLHTGTVSADIPIYVYKDIDFEIPISLSYASNGFIPDIQAGSSGLGWYLNVGGCITRKVNGYPDESGGNWEGISVRGYQKYLEDIKPSDYSLISQIKHYRNYPMISTKRYPNDNDAKNYETTPDVFSFKFMGHTGNFILVKSEDTIGARFFNTSHPAGEYKLNFLEHRYNEYFKGYIIQITTGNGYIYTFSATATVDSKGYGIAAGCKTTLYSGYQSNSLNEKYELIEIQAPNGRIIRFGYSNIDKSENRTIGGAYGKFYGNLLNGTGYSALRGDEFIFKTINIKNESAFFPYWYKTETTVVALSSITIDDIQIKLEYTDKSQKERGHYSSGGDGGVTESAPGELKSAKKLDRISISNVKNKSNPKLLKECRMEYKYGKGNPVMLLSKITITGEGIYEMQYYDEDKKFPYHCSLAVDHWGYYNGKLSSNVKDMVPKPTIKGNLETLGSRHRDPDASFARLGMLKRLTYPTKGYSEFEYEEHQFSEWINCHHVGDRTPYEVSGSTKTWRTGGLRIKKITDYIIDPQDSSSNYKKIANSRRYEYIDRLGNNSGKLNYFPRYVNVRSNPFDFSNGGASAAKAIALIELVEASVEELRASSMDRTHIEYSDVKEYHADSSCIHYEFTTFKDIDDDWEGQDVWSGTINMGPASLDYEYCDETLPNSMQAYRGKLVCTNHIDSKGKLVSSTTVDYDWTKDLEYIEEAKPGAFSTYLHRIYTDDYPIVGSTTTSYFENEEVVSKVSYKFNDLKQIKEVIVSGSKGDSIKTFKSYAHEMPDGVLRNTIMQKNLLSYPLKTIKTAIDDLKKEKIIDGTYYNYEVGSSGLVNLASYAKPIITLSSTINNLTFEPEFRFTYNSKGRIIQVEDKMNIPTSYIWKHNGLHMVAEVLYTRYDIAASKLKDHTDTGELSKTEKEALQSFPGCSTIYDYNLFGQLTRVIDPWGQTMNYIYNKNYKLQEIRDGDNKLLQSFSYSSDF